MADGNPIRQRGRPLEENGLIIALKLGATMKDYIVNVRAIVRARAVDEKAAANPLGWVVHDTAMEGDMTVMECDTLVEVRAETAREAVKRAKDRAPTIEMADFKIKSVKLWVDRATGINPDTVRIPTVKPN